jgi:hypothetical protein
MLTLRNFTVNNIDVLNKKECEKAHSQIKDLQDIWIKRHPTVPFYTLGASNYFDIAYNPELPYYDMTKKYNPILLDRLDWLYKRLADVLAKHLQAPVEYPDDLAIPGFHIFEYHEAFRQLKPLTHEQWFRHRYDPNVIGSAIHADTPQYAVKWGTKEGIDFSNPISFTLPIAMPKSGAGMYVWDLRLDETIGLKETQLENLFKTRDKQLYSYQLGKMSLHSGLNYHQIAASENMQSDDVRITLQGHGLFVRGSWKLYW